MNRHIAAILAVLALAPAVGPAVAADSLCEGVFTRSSPGTAAAGYYDRFRKGDRIDVITQYNVTRKTGAAEYCTHGGGCYPAAAVKLTNCRIDLRAPESEDDETLTYALILERDKVDPETLRAYDIEEKLRGFGMCNACAPGAVEAYLKHPGSRCGKLVKRALEGSPDAQRKLTDDAGPC